MTDRKPDDAPATKTTTAGAQKSRTEPTEPTPLAVSLEPTSGPEHTPIMITGTDFGDTAGTLNLNEVPAPILLWTPIAISTIVPYGAKTGDLMVITADGRRGSAPFTVTEKHPA